MSSPQYKIADGPPPPLRGGSKSEGAGGVVRPAPPAPRPVVPSGTPPPDGMAWPPPEGDPTVCLLREMKGQEVITTCGRYLRIPKGQSQSGHVTIWESDVSCQHCRARVRRADA